jgi:hypothetical protein
LVRSYAIGLIPDTRSAVKSKGDGYEADTDQDMGTENEDNSDTPKIVKNKPKVRDLIQAQRDDLAISKAQEDMKVSVTSFKREYLMFLFDQVCEVDSTPTCVS